MAVEPAIRSDYVRIGGQRIHYLQAGQGEPVVLVHGIAASAVDWHLTMPALAQHFAVTTVDLPGFGDSEVPATTNGLADGLAFLDGVLDWLDAGPAALVGNSLGGLLCGHYAVAHPARVRRLLLVNPVGLGRELSIYFRLLALPWLGERMLRPNPNVGKLAAAGLFADASLAPSIWMADKALDRGPAARRYMLAALRHGVNVRGMRRPMLMLEGLRQLSLPMLVVWGAHDRVVPVRHVQLLAQRMPAAQTYIFANAGHLPMLECPNEFNRLATEFLSSGVDGSAAGNSEARSIQGGDGPS